MLQFDSVRSQAPPPPEPRGAPAAPAGEAPPSSAESTVLLESMQCLTQVVRRSAHSANLYVAGTAVAAQELETSAQGIGDLGALLETLSLALSSPSDVDQARRICADAQEKTAFHHAAVSAAAQGVTDKLTAGSTLALESLQLQLAAGALGGVASAGSEDNRTPLNQRVVEFLRQHSVLSGELEADTAALSHRLSGEDARSDPLRWGGGGLITVGVVGVGCGCIDLVARCTVFVRAPWDRVHYVPTDRLVVKPTL